MTSTSAWRTSTIINHFLGNFLPSSQPRATPLFDDQYQCLVDQYSGFYVSQVDKYIDGSRTLGENIADNGAILPTYRAYGEPYVK